MSEISWVETAFRLALAAVLSGFIGYEREYRHKPAGMRTNMLVGMGTAAMTMVSIAVARFSPSPEAVDVSRIASTILTGIGFIGAGTIIRSRGHVLGLTTAASIWVVAAIGLATGMGLYPIAIFTTVMALAVLAILRNIHIPEECEKQEQVFVLPREEEKKL